MRSPLPRRRRTGDVGDIELETVAYVDRAVADVLRSAGGPACRIAGGQRRCVFACAFVLRVQTAGDDLVVGVGIGVQAKLALSARQR